MGFPLAVVACAGPDKGPAGVAELDLPNPLRLKALFLIFSRFPRHLSRLSDLIILVAL